MLPGLLLALAISAPVVAQTIQSNDNTVLKQIIVFGRHGVRAPTATPAQYAQVSPRPYPNFGVSTGYLTVHGQQAEVLLGAYFRNYLQTEGLLTGNATADLDATYFRANSIQRSNVTAAMFGQGLFPGATIPVHSYALGAPDPVFDPILAQVANVDPARAALEEEQVYAGGSALASAYSAEFSLVRSVLYNYQNGTEPPPPAPPGVTDPTVEPIPLTATAGPLYTGGIVNLGGLEDTENAADPFVMEYTAGLPNADVAWGALSNDALSQQLRLATLTLNIVMETPYVDQVQSSNAAAHVLRSLTQAATGSAVPGAFAAPSVKVQVVISSDAYVAGLAGLLQRALAASRLSAGLLRARGSARIRTAAIARYGQVLSARLLHRTRHGPVAQPDAIVAGGAAGNRAAFHPRRQYSGRELRRRFRDVSEACDAGHRPPICPGSLKGDSAGRADKGAARVTLA